MRDGGHFKEPGDERDKRLWSLLPIRGIFSSTSPSSYESHAPSPETQLSKPAIPQFSTGKLRLKKGGRNRAVDVILCVCLGGNLSLRSHFWRAEKQLFIISYISYDDIVICENGIITRGAEEAKKEGKGWASLAIVMIS